MRSRSSPRVVAATAAAMLFSTGLVSSAFAGDEAKVHCSGVNSCKGQSACKSESNCSGPKNDCRGQNACKGQGWLEMTKSECKAALEELNNSDNSGNNGG